MSCSDGSVTQPIATSTSPFATMALHSAPRQPHFVWASDFGANRYDSAPRDASRSPSDDTNNSWRFVTVSRPEEFKDQSVMRSVRSHVMFDVVEKRKAPAPGSVFKAKVSKSLGTGQRARASSASASRSSAGSEVPPTSNPSNPATISNEQALQILRQYPKSKASSSTEGSPPRSETTAEASSPESIRVKTKKKPKHDRASIASRASITPSNASNSTTEDAEVVLIEPPKDRKYNPLYAVSFKNGMGPLRAFAEAGAASIAAPYNAFSAYDPFHMLPQPSNPQINVEYLKYYCHHYFGTRHMCFNWLPQMIGTRESFLSTLAITTTHLDVMHGQVEPSPLTRLVYIEAVHLIHEALTERWRRVRDSTIMSVVHIVAGQIVNAPDELAAHELGLRLLIAERGGLQALGLRGELAALAAVMCFTAAIFRETQPDAMFLAVQANPDAYPANSGRPIPESPVFSPRAPRFPTLSRSKTCSAPTLALLGRLRDLTDLCLDPPPIFTPAELDARKRELLAFVLALPSAYTPPALPARAADKAAHRHEAVRLTALVYATALVERVPLSSAATLIPPQPNADADADITAVASASALFPASTSPAARTVPVLAALRAALAHSDCSYSDCWTDMTGVLHWATLVAGASAAGAGARGAAETGLRRYFCALNVRAAIVLAFEHREAVVAALRRVLRVVAFCAGDAGEMGMEMVGSGVGVGVLVEGVDE
ncbi:uncharacterized protein K452DRAFT_355995 [Aplosporella prunicola CBS 121167]|uniref:Tachykinin family protein n=1 Tax=Aplosporella prunicola CBS 121167 TaxID=1176127 RepID=A0A6A6BQI4_9PEZI|nr:uncharacterized protein K452DRAFT_355995 [Aplosporella prunicola CBS 121167]KAF2145565.1 hypothetical protein K452DRAFT_355995 [Aplosporella prunicola CBS 121167]